MSMREAPHSPGPLLIAVGGWMASGKSSLAAALASRIGAKLLCADAVRRELHDGGREDAYVPGFSATLYPELLHRVEEELRRGARVVVEGSFRARSMRSSVRQLAARLGVPFRFVECRARPQTCRGRLRHREQETGTKGWLEMFEAFLSLWEPADELPPEEHVVLETEGSVGASLDALLAALGWVTSAPRGRANAGASPRGHNLKTESG